MALKEALLADPMGDTLTSPTGPEIKQQLLDICRAGDQTFNCHLLRNEAAIVVSAGTPDTNPTLTITIIGHEAPFVTLTFDLETSLPIVIIDENISWATLGNAIGNAVRWPNALSRYNEMLVQTANSQINVTALQELGIRK